MNRVNRVLGELNLARRAVHVRFMLVQVVCALMPRFTLSTARACLYRLTGMKIAKGVSFLHTVSITGSGPNPCRRLTIGEDTIISSNSLFNLEGTITIGRNVMVSQFVRIYTSRHEMGGSERRFDPAFSVLPVVIEDGAWIGTSAIILPGVTIGRGSVVSAGSVVRRDVPPNTLVSGVPAEIVRELP